MNKLSENKITVERHLELIDIDHKNDYIISTIKLPDGNIETITSYWLIGCDGANSIIREKCQISFLGKDVPEQFMVADAKMNSSLPKNQLHVFFDKGIIFSEKSTVFSAFPLEKNEYRLSANLYFSHPRLSFKEHEVREIIAERTYGHYLVDKISWISPFWIHSKIVNNMRCNRIFLAGDAAHIHSPAGGQGMNAGLQDAYNLAWKLALVIQQKAKAPLLESYHQERHPIVSSIVEKTEYLTNMILFDKSFIGKLRKFTTNISRSKKTAKKIAMDLTQLNIKYKPSAIIIKESSSTKTFTLLGKRAPNVILENSKTFYHYLSLDKHNVLLFTGLKSNKNKLVQLLKIRDYLYGNLHDIFQLNVISKNQLSDINDVILDPIYLIHKKYRINNTCILVIRPDNHIACYSEKIDINLLKQFIYNYLETNSS